MRLVLFFLLISCSKQQAPPGAREIPVASLEEANRIAQQASLRCEKECPENVGLLLAKTKTNLLTCTSFLVGDNLLATNSHCLPYETKRLHTCENMEVVFPATKEFPEQRISCASIEGFSERPTALSPDLAILRLSKTTKRNPIPISPVASGSLFVKKINPAPGASGFLVEERCEQTNHSPSPTGTYSVMLLSGCSASPGNSGSPLFNERGEAVGLFQANFSLPKSEPSSLFALATNLNCLEQLPWSWKKDCGPIREMPAEWKAAKYQPN